MALPPYEKRRLESTEIYTIDIVQQEIHDVAQKFTDLLSRANVQTGKALQIAESIYKGKLKKKVLEETLPEAWNRLISEPDSLLLDLLSESTEKLCGFKPETNEVTRFLERHEAQFLLSPEEEVLQPPIKIGTPPKPIHKGKKKSQDDLIPQIVQVLKNRRACT